MLPRFASHCVLKIAGSLTFALAAAVAQATPTTLTGQVGSTSAVTASGYAAQITGMRYTTGGTAFGGTGLLFCDDAFDSFPAAGSTHRYDVVGLAGQMDHPDAAARAEDYMNWVFDHYYASIFLTAGGDTNGAGYGFNSVLWEIRHDYDGTAASINATSGHIYAYDVPAYVEILNALKTADIAVGYRSDDYQLSFLNDENSHYQSMVLLTAASAPGAANHAVPEPSSLALSLLGGVALWLRRHRASKG